MDNHEQSETRVNGVSPTVEELGKGFVAAWLLNHDTRIESWLSNVPEDLQNEAHDMLIRLEVYIRASHGEVLEPEEFHKRFPDYELEVEQAFRPDSQSASLPEPSEPSGDPTQTSVFGESASFNMATRYDVVPERIGRYEIESVLGTGGFGVVCLARDTELNRPVALKFARTSRFRNRQEMKDLIKEARTAAQLDHPGIVSVHDVLVDGELVAIIQQYIEGPDLAQKLKDGLLPFRETAELLIGVCHAISFAHSKGFVHRDLKPANVLLNEKGEPHIADFGLAIHESFQRRRRGDQSGTPRYMSPELVRGESHRIDGRSDIWSIGVMLYRMLTGKRPFSGETRAELFDEIKNRDPKPPRQMNSNIPVELERICLTCLQKPVSKRFATASDVAVDLEHWLKSSSTSLAESDSASIYNAEVIPKGLRSFEAEDADFFLSLLPGPFSRDGLPETIRFWKGQIERRDAEALQIGLLYGPSGCGKSSLMKAGLIPNLAPFVKPIRVDATPADTEIRLIKALRTRYPEIPTELTLPELFHSIREGVWSTGNDRILIVIDQFEQWLHNRSSYPHTELVEALRHCDGQRLQCLLMVRDDFWLATSRFLKALEIDLVEGKNAALVDLFDKSHAEKVLRRYGRGYGRLDEELTRQQEQFISMAVDELAQDNRVICVRLALFAEMFKDKPWTVSSLRKAGGISGVGVAFLEDTFSSRNARPEHRLHEQAARNILGALLPDSSSDIRGNMRSRQDLLHASGYTNRPNAFGDALRILDNELRLITPTDPEGIGSNQETDAIGSRDYYQLTHDYLVPSLRRWLHQKQRETLSGRAQLRLDERFATWSKTRENRYLPPVLEYLNLRTFTRQSNWSPGEAELMRKCDRLYGLGFVAVVAVLLIAGFLGNRWYSGMRAESFANRIVEAETTDVASIVDEVQDAALQRQVVGDLQEAGDLNDKRQKLNVDLALARLARIPANRERLWNGVRNDVKIENIRYVAEAITPEPHEIETLWTTLGERENHSEGQRLRAAAVLSHWAPSDPRWQDYSLGVARDILAQSTPGKWADAMADIRQQLYRAFVQHIADWKLEGADRMIPATAVALLLGYEDDLPEIQDHLVGILGNQPVAGDPALVSEDQVAELESNAQVRANLAMTLLAMGADNEALPNLIGRENKRTREIMIRSFVPFGIREPELLEMIPAQANAEVRSALWLALDGYLPREIPAGDQFLTLAKNEFQSHPDARVHSACEYWLRKNGQQSWINEALSNLHDDSRENRNWRVTPLGHTLIAIAAPGEFEMSYNRKATLDWAYEVSSQNITWEQWLHYLPEHRAGFEQQSSNPDFATTFRRLGLNDSGSRRPATSICWYEVAHYCNWLTIQDGLAAEQQCYAAILPGLDGKQFLTTSYLRAPVKGRIWCWPEVALLYMSHRSGETFLWHPVYVWKPKLQLVHDYQQRNGYRLPIEPEWEWLELRTCKEEAQTEQFTRLFGDREWYGRNGKAVGGTRPCGWKMPGEFGMFDLFGNVQEFCSDPFGSFDSDSSNPQLMPGEDYLDPVEFWTRHPSTAWQDASRLAKGIPYFRHVISDTRMSHLPTSRSDYTGFRVVRIPPVVSQRPSSN